MPSSKLSRMYRGLVVLSLCLICSTLLSAQSTGGRILGRVSDSSGAVLAKVKVTLTNEATGVSGDTSTNSNGDYSFPQVSVGTYRMEFDLGGFKKNLQRGVNVDLNQVVTVNSVLQVGATREIVEVTSEAPLVDTTSTQLGSIMDAQQVSNMPLNARDTYALLQLQPGVQGVGGSDLFYGSNVAGGVSVNGGRSRSNNFSVNGGDGNDLFVNSPAVQPTPDSIAEFRVLSNTFDAEYGRNSGAVINVVTKSGTNSLHGNVYEFLRNQKFNAKGFLDLRRPDDKQNQFGGTLGGPIVKDRTFFFASYEGRRVVHGLSSDQVTVPTAAERNGDFSATPFAFNPGDPTLPTATIGDQLVADIFSSRAGCLETPANVGDAYAVLFPGSIVPTACFDPVAADIMKRFVPCPNADPGCQNLDPNADRTFRSIPNDRNHADQLSLKFDHRVNAKQNLSLYYFFNDSTEAAPFTRFQAATPNLLQGFGNNNAFRVQQINLSHTWTVSTSTVNELRLTYFREAQGTFLHPQHTNNVTDSCNSIGAANCFNGITDTPDAFSANLPNPLDANNPKYGITPNLGPNREGVPFISVSGAFTIGNNFEGELPQIGNSYSISDNITKVMGNHTAKFGVDLRDQRFLQTLYFDVSGDYSYFGGGLNDPVALDVNGNQNLLPNYLFGLPDSYLQGSAQTEDVRGKSLYLYAQDSWKIRPNLTLNYGLRWEFNQPIYDAGKRYQTFRPGQADTVFQCALSDTSLGALGASNPNCADPNSDSAAVFPLGLVIPGDKGIQRGLTASYHNAWAPRIGIAWDPWKNGKTTIRGGWGLFYNPIEQLVLEQFQAEPPFGGSSLISEGLFNTPFISQGGTVTPNPFNGILTPAPGSGVDWAVFRPIILFGELEPKLRSQYSAQYNFGITRELTRDTVLSIGYVGTQGHRLLATHDINFGNPQTCVDLQNISDLTGDGNLACGPFFADSPYSIAAGEIPAGVTLHMPYGSQAVVTGPNPTPITLVGLRKYSSPRCDPFSGNGCPADGVPVFSSIFAQDTIANSNYNSLQASLERRLSHGFQFELAYTFSKSIDNASSFENILKPICNRCNRALSLFDARQRLVFSYLWELPVPKYQGLKGQVLDGWAVSGVTSFQSGFPVRIGSSNDSELMNSFDFELPGKPDLIAPFHTFDPRKHGGYAFDPNSFALPVQSASSTPLQLLGTSPRTLCCGPAIDNSDFSVQKIFRVGENKHFEFRSDFFNIFNHTQFTNPDGNISDGADFGRVKHTRDARYIQFALKFAF
jgi:Carboxypeptidase regulatory-like domain/TonB dependent receptor